MARRYISTPIEVNGAYYEVYAVPYLRNGSGKTIKQNGESLLKGKISEIKRGKIRGHLFLKEGEILSVNLSPNFTPSRLAREVPGEITLTQNEFRNPESLSKKIESALKFSDPL